MTLRPSDFGRVLPNKPMVPTPLTSPAVSPPNPLRRDIGQPFYGASHAHVA